MTIKRLGKAAASVPTKSTPPATAVKRLLGDIRTLIESARQQTARTVNAGLVMLYWSIGNRIRRDILRQKRAEYGEEIVPTVSAQLTIEYGRGFSRANLFSMVRFTEVFPDLKIVQTLSGQLGNKNMSEGSIRRTSAFDAALFCRYRGHRRNRLIPGRRTRELRRRRVKIYLNSCIVIYLAGEPSETTI